MSLGIYPVFQPALAGIKFEALGEVLAHNWETLDQIARDANLILFSAFADNREIPDNFDGDPDELAELMGEWTEWFDPSDGRAAIKSLVQHIKLNPSARARLVDTAYVIEELEEMVSVLGLAESQGVRFRLQMS